MGFGGGGNRGEFFYISLELDSDLVEFHCSQRNIKGDIKLAEGHCIGEDMLYYTCTKENIPHRQTSYFRVPTRKMN